MIAMGTPFIPVTVTCPKCRCRYIEWITAKECEGKTRRWRLEISCDMCYGKGMTPKERLHFATLCNDRRKLLHDMYAKDCSLDFLDLIHAELFKRGQVVYASHIVSDRLPPNPLPSGHTDN
jgi:hypothetical protein